MKKTLLIDFDGTMSAYTGWKGLTELDPPLLNARKALILLSRDFKLVCFTTRAIGTPDLIEQWLRRNGFPPMEVTAVKKPCHLMIDDRAITFKGEWTDQLLADIRAFQPYWEPSKSCSS